MAAEKNRTLKETIILPKISKNNFQAEDVKKRKKNYNARVARSYRRHIDNSDNRKTLVPRNFLLQYWLKKIFLNDNSLSEDRKYQYLLKREKSSGDYTIVFIPYQEHSPSQLHHGILFTDCVPVWSKVERSSDAFQAENDLIYWRRRNYGRNQASEKNLLRYKTTEQQKRSLENQWNFFKVSWDWI